MNKILMAFIFTALVLTGCTMIPEYQRPQVQVPLDWANGEAAEKLDIHPQWWQSFDSTELSKLMAQALAENNDLQAGVYRIEQSRAALKVAGASLLPSADSSASASRTRTNPSSGKTTYATSWRSGAGVSYELDLFGANRAGVIAADANLVAAEENQRALALVTMGDVATQYFTILNLRNRLDIADRNLDIAREILRIVNARFDAGTESGLAVSQQKSSLASAEASRVSLEEQLINTENAFSVLLGRPPQTIAIEAESLSDLTVPKVAPGQPSTLLKRRPDIRAAEAGLVAANADIGAARAAFFPTVNIGLDWSIAAAGFGEPTSTAAALASALAMPLFQGGRLEAGVDQANARQKELAENYQQTVLVAFQETENALVAVKASQDREKSLKIARDEAKKSYDLTKKLYDAGSADFQTVLDVQRTLLSAEDVFAQARLDRLLAALSVYMAIGGGWSYDIL